MNITAGGGWYFYNPSAISLGYSEFLSRWGNRKLEDNWRRKNKNQVLNPDDILSDGDIKEPDEQEKYSRDYYLSQLPLTEDQQLVLLSKIETAYYDLSSIFKEDLQNYNQAIVLYNELMDRFPSTDYRQLIYFDMYNIYNLQGDTITAKEFLIKIEEEYPNSNYLQVLENGTLDESTYEKDKKIYLNAYNLYTNYSTESCDKLDSICQINTENTFIAQLELLNVFCQAKSLSKPVFISKLEKVGEKYPKTNVANKIDTMILILTGEAHQILETAYINEFESPHYFFILLNDVSINLPKTQQIIASFNELNYKLDSLETANMLLTKQSQILRVGELKNKAEALIYYELIQKDPKTQNMFLNSSLVPFVISKNNFTQLLKERNISEYRGYFNSIYLLN